MTAISNCNKTSNPLWKRLRKQELAFEDRIRKRVKDQLNKDALKQREEFLLGTMSIVKQVVQPDKFR